MIYMASPYSHISPAMMEERFRVAEWHTAHFIRRGTAIYSPIVHCHELAKRYAMPQSFTFWQSYNEALLRQSLALWVLRLPYWEQSKGVIGEIEFATRNHIHIEYIAPLWLGSLELTESSTPNETSPAKTTESGSTTDSIVA